MKLPSAASAQLPPHISIPTTDVLPATPPTSGMPHQRLAFHAPEIAIGIHPLLNANAALKVSLSMPPSLDAPAPVTILTTMLLPRNVSLATAHLSGTTLTQNALPALKDPHGMPRPVFALAPEQPHSLIPDPENALNAPMTSPSGTDTPVLLALLEPTTMSIQRPAPFAQKDSFTMLVKEPALLLHDDR